MASMTLRTWATALLMTCAATLAGAQSCDCQKQLEWVRDKISINYAGYRDKATAQNQAALEELTTRLTAAASETPDTACLRLMRQWLGFFHDGHLQINGIGSSAQLPPDSIRACYARERSIPISLQRAKQLLDIRGEKTTPVEGIWENMEGNYQVALLATPIGATTATGYSAIILRADSVWWVPGQIKFTLSLMKAGRYEANYSMRDHSPRPTSAYTDGKILHIQDIGYWRKVYPEQVDPAALLTFRSPFDPPGGRPGEDFSLTRYSSQTLLLRVPTFDHTLRHRLDSLLTVHQDWLSSHPNLIIDLRNNGGGSDISYHNLLPLLYTRPIQVMGIGHWATPENAEKYRLLAQDKAYPKSVHDMALKREKKMLRQPNTLLSGKDTRIKIKGGRRDFPRRVALLLNDGCASSCEQFVLAASQSDKVTLIGRPTAGVLDYGNLHTATFPCGKWQLSWPTSRSMRIDRGQGIDGKGIAPQVQPPADAQDWVEFCRQWLEKN